MKVNLNELNNHIKILIGNDYTTKVDKYKVITYVNRKDLIDLMDWFESIEYENVCTRKYFGMLKFSNQYDYHIYFTDDNGNEWKWLFEMKKSY